MKTSILKLISAPVIVAIGAYAGVLLISYSEADDAPGGVVLGFLVIAGAVLLGVRTAWRKT